MNNYSNYGSYNYGNSSYFNTNIILVTSLEEALYNRNNIPGSDMIYFHQTEHVFYRVRVDMRGEKSWQTLRYTSGDDNFVPVNRTDFDELVKRVSNLENAQGYSTPVQEVKSNE